MSVAKESLYKPIEIIIMGIGIFFVVLILHMATNYEINTYEINSYLIRNKIIMDENCLAYKDYRIELGSIDKSKFNKLHLSNCINTNYGIRLNLTYENYSELILINENLAEKVYFCFDEESFACYGKEYNIILKDNNKKMSAKLIIETISSR